MRNDIVRLALLAGAILGISLLHYLTATEWILLHQIYQRLYYVPVVAGSLWFGLWGGIATALISSALYFPHILHAWAGNAVYRWNQYYEIAIILLVGVVTGMLSTAEKRQRRSLERAMADLSAAYRRLQQAFDELQKKDRMSTLGHLAAGIAHEIRNPLGSIQGAIDIVETGDDAGRKEFAGIIRKEIGRLNSLINDLLNFARPRPLEFHQANVNDVAKGLVQLVRKQAETHHVRLIESYAKLPDIEIDPEQIRAALMNIVLNGIQAMPSGGEIRLSTAMTTDRTVRIEIADGGTGIPEDARERLFEPFFTTRKEGTGLGLPIADQIIRNHRGRLVLERTGASGSVFAVELPV